jgi:hypothetical protein
MTWRQSSPATEGEDFAAVLDQWQGITDALAVATAASAMDDPEVMETLGQIDLATQRVAEETMLSALEVGLRVLHHTIDPSLSDEERRAVIAHKAIGQVGVNWEGEPAPLVAVALENWEEQVAKVLGRVFAEGREAYYVGYHDLSKIRGPSPWGTSATAMLARGVLDLDVANLPYQIFGSSLPHNLDHAVTVALSMTVKAVAGFEGSLESWRRRDRRDEGAIAFLGQMTMGGYVAARTALGTAQVPFRYSADVRAAERNVEALVEQMERYPRSDLIVGEALNHIAYSLRILPKAEAEGNDGSIVAKGFERGIALAIAEHDLFTIEVPGFQSGS